MITFFIIGNIASGKSCATRYLEARGARRIDLDELAKSLYQPGSQLVADVADEFGWDVLDASGGIRRDVLARRAFADPEAVERLNAIVRPRIKHQLGSLLLPANCCSTLVPSYPLTVVEVSAPQGFEDAFGLADEVVAITAPLELRRERAIRRGMSPDDFERRAEVQPSEEQLCALAGTVIDNAAADGSLFDRLDALVAAQGIDLPVSPATARQGVAAGSPLEAPHA